MMKQSSKHMASLMLGQTHFTGLKTERPSPYGRGFVRRCSRGLWMSQSYVLWCDTSQIQYAVKPHILLGTTPTLKHLHCDRIPTCNPNRKRSSLRWDNHLPKPNVFPKATLSKVQSILHECLQMWKNLGPGGVPLNLREDQYHHCPLRLHSFRGSRVPPFAATGTGAKAIGRLSLFCSHCRLHMGPTKKCDMMPYCCGRIVPSSGNNRNYQWWPVLIYRDIYRCI